MAIVMMMWEANKMNQNTRLIDDQLHNLLNQSGNINSKYFYDQLNHYLLAFNCELTSLGYADTHITDSNDQTWLDSLLAHHMTKDNVVIIYCQHPVKLMNHLDVNYLSQIIVDIYHHSPMIYCDALHFVVKMLDKHVINF